VAAAGSAAAEDLTIVSRVSRDDGSPATATSYVASDHVRMVQPDGQEFMLDGRTGEMTIIDARKKEYFVITDQDLAQLRARIRQQTNSPEMQQAQEKMKNMPPELQKKMEAMMGGMVSAIDVRKTGTTRKVAGYTCENWTIAMGQISRSEQCVTSDLPFPAQVWDRYRDFAEGMKSMAAAFGPLAKGMAQAQEKLKQIKGFPLATTILGRSRTQSSEVTEIKRGPIPSSAWAIPAGYKKVDNPLLKDLRSK
jgi:hypothetical protein